MVHYMQHWRLLSDTSMEWGFKLNKYENASPTNQ